MYEQLSVDDLRYAFGRRGKERCLDFGRIFVEVARRLRHASKDATTEVR